MDMEKNFLHNNAQVFGEAKVYDHVPQVYGYAVLCDKTSIQGDTIVQS